MWLSTLKKCFSHCFLDGPNYICYIEWNMCMAHVWMMWVKYVGDVGDVGEVDGCG